MISDIFLDLGQNDSNDFQNITNFTKLTPGSAEIKNNTGELVQVGQYVHSSQDQIEEKIIAINDHNQNFATPKRRGRRSKESKLIVANSRQFDTPNTSKNQKNVNSM